jgi:D-glycero-alpha-D-manno-heptose 1-phosphate guanylyltransferase
MEAVVLAGGFGTRLRAVVADVPKPMAPIAGRPFLEILLSMLAQKGFTRVVLSLGFMSEKVIAHFGDCFAGIQIAYVVESKPLGTGGAVRLAMEQCQEDHFFVLNGDTYLDLEVDAVEQQWQHHHRTIMVGRAVPDASRYGCLLVDDAKVIGFTEKGVAGPGIINAGCYVFKRDLLNNYPLNSAFSLESDYLAKAVVHAPIDIFVTDGQFIDIGVPEDFLLAQTELAHR